MQIPSPPSHTLPKHDPPPSSAEERWSQPPLGDPPLPAASSSSQAGGRVRERGPREDDLNAEAPPAYTASANVWQGEVTLEDRLRRPFERVNRRQPPPPALQQQYVPPPPPQQMPPFRHPLLPPGMRSVNVTYQHQRRTGQYRYQVQYQQQDQPPPAPPQHTHSRTATQPPSRPPSPSSTSSASSATTTPVSDFVQDVSDFARNISDFARHFSAAGAGDWSTEHMGGPGWSSSTTFPSTRTVTAVNVVHNINIIRDQNHSFAFSFWGIARAFYGKHDNLRILYISGGH